MWKLAVIAIVISVAAAQDDARGMRHLQENLTALWEEFNAMRHAGGCRSQVRVVLDADQGGHWGAGSRGNDGEHGHRGDGDHGHHSSEEEDADADSAEEAEVMDAEATRGEEGRQSWFSRKWNDWSGHGNQHHGSHEGGHHGEGNHHEGEIHVHVHVEGGHGGSGGMRSEYGDIMHGYPMIPEDMRDREVHASCRFQGDLSGAIEMRQRIGGGPLEMDFAVSGFPTGMEGHHHAFTVRWSGAPAEGCGSLGRVFAPPHHKKDTHWSRRPGTHEEGEMEEEAAPGEEAETRAGRGEGERGEGGRGEGGRGEGGRGEGGRNSMTRSADDSSMTQKPVWMEGNLGTVSCNAEGELQTHDEYEKISLIGLHSIGGRALSIHADSSTDSDPIGCCTISYSGSEHWVDVEMPL